MDSFNEVSLPHAIPLAPPEQDEDTGTWIWIENDSNINNLNAKCDNSYSNDTSNINSDEKIFSINKTNFSWIKHKIDKLFDVAEKSYKFVEKKPELAIVAVGFSVGVMYVTTKLILNGGLIYY